MNSPSTKAIETTQPPRIPAGRYLLYFGSMLTGCFVDLGTKAYIFRQHFDPQSQHPGAEWWIDGWFGIQTSTNRGALFGMGQGGSFWFALLSFAALVGIIFWLFFRRGALDLWLTISLGSISGGILGNLYDRLGFWHGMEAKTFQGKPLNPGNIYAVRDWIHFRWEDGPLKILDPWPNFNIADCLLVGGAIALFVHALFMKPGPKPEQDEDADSAESNSSQDASDKSSRSEKPKRKRRPNPSASDQVSGT